MLEGTVTSFALVVPPMLSSLVRVATAPPPDFFLPDILTAVASPGCL